MRKASQIMSTPASLAASVVLHLTALLLVFVAPSLFQARTATWGSRTGGHDGVNIKIVSNVSGIELPTPVVTTDDVAPSENVSIRPSPNRRSKLRTNPIRPPSNSHQRPRPKTQRKRSSQFSGKNRQRECSSTSESAERCRLWSGWWELALATDRPHRERIPPGPNSQVTGRLREVWDLRGIHEGANECVGGRDPARAQSLCDVYNRCEGAGQ
jgi:hypothetical protein